MKPTEKQIKAIDTIVSIVKSWKNTNDITSPTLRGDVQYELFAQLEDVINEEERVMIEISLKDLLFWIIGLKG